MKKVMLALAFLIVLGQSGCAFLGGAAVGALGTSAGYEINAKSKMDQLENDYKAERISRKEYEARKSQIEKGSIIY
ncbi:MAG TPA: hypothetical protein VGA01_19810 [Candidatus Binatia bacterium]